MNAGGSYRRRPSSNWSSIPRPQELSVLLSRLRRSSVPTSWSS